MKPAIVLAVVLAAATAQANGRAPLTNGIFFRPGDTHSIYVGTTFGLLISHDDGCTMQWVCEANIGYSGTPDPIYAVATDGTIFATTVQGLRLSRDGGCSFQTQTSLPADTWISALDIGPTGEVWVGTATTGSPNDIYSSTDNGQTFNSRGMLSPVIWWKSVKVAPSNAMRAYIGGYQVAGMASDAGMAQQPAAHIMRTDDDGQTWTEAPLTAFQFGSTPIVLIMAVDPQNADIVYAISQAGNQNRGDILYRSADAGATWTQVLVADNSIQDVVITTTTVYVATLIQSGTTYMGGTSYTSADHGVTFTPLANAPQLACLGERSDGALIGCGANWQPDYMSIARSTDNATTWQKVWRFVDLAGPLACPSGTPEQDVCNLQQWSILQQQFGACGPSCGSAAVSCAVVDAGPPPPPKKKTGCCDTGGGGPLGLVWAGALALFLGRRRR
ncbi:MAG TPA: sialidase family protein [Kofleriaceae bacterium]|jgi:uncharacterized protein (TIGR03382 family)